MPPTILYQSLILDEGWTSEAAFSSADSTAVTTAKLIPSEPLGAGKFSFRAVAGDERALRDASEGNGPWCSLGD